MTTSDRRTRDWFAGVVAQGLMQRSMGDVLDESYAKYVARKAYMIANALMAESEKQSEVEVK